MRKKIFKINQILRRYGTVLASFLIFALPASTNYKLYDYGMGGGGMGGSTSPSYAIDGIFGEVNTTSLVGSSYNVGPGMVYTQQAHVPSSPTFTNPSNYYNKLQFVLDTGGNPSDAKFAIAISTDNFVTTNYVQNDNTIGSALGIEDYQTYAAWGGASGALVTGLTASTTYKMKVKAMAGMFTETGYGPIATASTVGPSLSFDIDVSATDSDSDAPYSVNLGSVSTSSVTTSSVKVWVDFDSNAENGSRVYIAGQNAGLLSASTGASIASATADLSVASSGFGIQNSTVTQGSGGPLSVVSPYNGSGENVGIVDTTLRELLSSSNPLTAGRASFVLKAKATSVTLAASDYTETYTIVASAAF